MSESDTRQGDTGSRDTGSRDTAVASRYIEPNWFTRHVFNPLVAGLTRMGIGVWGSVVLEVRGRESGEWRSTPVNVLTIADRRYLVAPRGETHWVKNLRAVGTCRLRVGHRVETVDAVELGDDDKPAVLRPYLRRWKWEVGQFFDGVGPDAGDEELRAIAPNHPVFSIGSR